MKKVLALCAAALMIVSLAACGNSGKDSSGSASASATEQTTVAETTAPAPVTEDVASWTWTDGELDCYGYDDCYMSYKVPEKFKTSTEDISGLQSRNYYYNPSDDEANANNSPYGVYINFGQGSFGGATKSSMEGDIEGGLTERELGGRKVLFGEYPVDPNTGSHAFAYYVPYDEEEYSRIWIILCDPEEDGLFRSTFEQSMNFTK